MFHFVYASQAQNPMDQAALESILTVSRNKNRLKDITGLLIYRFSLRTHSGYFIQLIEGEERDLRELLAKIKRDNRHHGCILIGEGKITERTFPEWAMGFKNIDDEALKKNEGYASLDQAVFATKKFMTSNYHALDLLKFFYDAR